MLRLVQTRHLRLCFSSLISDIKTIFVVYLYHLKKIHFKIRLLLINGKSKENILRTNKTTYRHL